MGSRRGKSGGFSIEESSDKGWWQELYVIYIMYYTLCSILLIIYYITHYIYWIYHSTLYMIDILPRDKSDGSSRKESSGKGWWQEL